MSEFLQMLKNMFKHTAVVIITGVWQSGKTDMALLIALILKKMKMIEKIATNIQTSDPRFEYIYAIPKIRKWLLSDRKKKLYILDEAAEHVFRRDAASRQNKAIAKLLPQLSKGRARMILITQDMEAVDALLRKRVWVRGQIIKPSETNRKTAILISYQPAREMRVYDLPSVRDVFGVKFDRYAVAPLTLEAEEEEGEIPFKDSDIQLLWRWAVKGETYKTLQVNPNTLNRIVRKFVKQKLAEMKKTIEN